jgi:predicted enzyme related to lactoylglutathione lyase
MTLHFSLPRRTVRLAAALLLAFAALPSWGEGPSWPAITDPPTNSHVPGRWVWGELFTEDAAAARRFYGRLLGWTFDQIGAGEDSYTLARSGGEPVGGLLQRRHQYSQEKGSRWLGMVSVADVAAAAAYAEKHGGKVVVAPRALPGRGEVALLADPEGAPFGVIRSASGDPLDYLAEENQWVWIELWAKDPQAMADFYAGLAGYESEATAMPSGKTAYNLSSGGYLRCRVIPSPVSGQPSAWMPYARVSDVKAASRAAADAGGRVVAAPSAELRAGTLAIIIDPTGAALGLVQDLEANTP